MKKTIVAPGLFQDFGGPRKTIGNFSDALDADVYCFSDRRRLETEPLAVKRGIPVPSSNVPVLRQFLVPEGGRAEALNQAIHESSLVSCHMFYRYHVQWTRLMSKKYGVPYWFVPHGILDPWVMTYGKLQKQLFWKFGGRRFLDQASTVIFATLAERDKAASQFDLPGAEVIPWPVDLVDLADRDTKRVKIRSSLGIPEDARVLLYFGRLHPMKRPLETIEALAKTGSNPTQLIIVGNESGVTEADCMQLARKLGIEKRVHFIGPVYGESKFDYMHAADAYISLSHRENFNHTAAESLAAALPVILSPGNDLLSEIDGLGCAWRLADDTQSAAVAALEDFSARTHSQLFQMGSKGRAWVAEALSFSLFQQRLRVLADQFGKK